MPQVNTDPKNYDFVEYLKPQYFIDSENIRRKPDTPYHGYLDIEIVTVDPLFIGSGMFQMEKDDIYAETMHENGRLIIPGSSLKGAVRQICRAVSESCIPDAIVPNNYKLRCFPPNPVKHQEQRSCIVCDMFGMMSAASKVRFTDLSAEHDKTVVMHVPQQFAPDKSKENYKWEDGTHIGYKFYKTHCDPRSAAKGIAIKAVAKGTSFFGRVYFRDLHEKELELLLFALAQSRIFDLKLGGYKADGLGTVKIYCNGFMLNGKDVGADAAEEYAIAYENDLDKKHPATLDDLIEILKPKEA